MRGTLIPQGYFLSQLRTPRSICQTQTISRIKDQISTFRKGPMSRICSTTKKNMAPYARKIILPTSNIISKTDKVNVESTDTKNISVKGKLLKVFAEYGVVGMVFYGLSGCVTLGFSYTAVSYGVDVMGILHKLNLHTWTADLSNMKMLAGMTTFAVAYGFHHVFLPLRIILTVACTPPITQKLRHLGIIKACKKT